MRFARYAPVALFTLLIGACSDEGPDMDDGGLTVEDFVGTWVASSHVYVNNADAAQSFDLVANGGESRITVLSGGRARTWVTIGTFSDEWDSGFSIDGNSLTTVPVEAGRPTRTFMFTLTGDALTLVNASDAFDFTLTGATPVPATMTFTATR